MKTLFGIAAAVLMSTTAVPSFAAREVPTGEPGSISAPASAAGETSGDARPAPENWGGADYVTLTYSAIGFTPLTDGQWSHFGTSGWSFRAAGSNTTTCIDVNLPSGARLEGLTTYTNDTDAAAGADITYTFREVDLIASSAVTLLSFSTTGAPGISRLYRPLDGGARTVNNDRTGYNLCVAHGGAPASALQNAGATFWYKLQVSPAPAVATFPNDVPTTHPLFRFVEALAASGISGGCGTGSFCPDAPLTRGQMAVFLAAALGLHFPN